MMTQVFTICDVIFGVLTKQNLIFRDKLTVMVEFMHDLMCCKFLLSFACLSVCVSVFCLSVCIFVCRIRLFELFPLP